MNDISLIDLYGLISDLSLTGIITLTLIVLLFYRNSISEWLRCKRNTDEILNKIDKIIQTSQESNEKFEKAISTIDADKNIEELKRIKNEINSEIKLTLNELKVIFNELKAENSIDKINFIKIENTIENIEKKINKLLKIISKYFNLDDLDIDG